MFNRLSPGARRGARKVQLLSEDVFIVNQE